MVNFSMDPITADEADRLRGVYEPLTTSVRQLIEATIRSEVDSETAARANDLIGQATALLSAKQVEGSLGIRLLPSGEWTNWGSAAIGIRNPLAPPLELQYEPDRVWCDFYMGAAYEGTPGYLHGGMVALVCDHLVGEAASAELPHVTGTLTLRFVRGTPVGQLHAEARVARAEEYKQWVQATISDEHGVTVEAEGVVIVPRWARPTA